MKLTITACARSIGLAGPYIHGRVGVQWDGPVVTECDLGTYGELEWRLLVLLILLGARRASVTFAYIDNTNGANDS